MTAFMHGNEPFETREDIRRGKRVLAEEMATQVADLADHIKEMYGAIEGLDGFEGAADWFDAIYIGLWQTREECLRLEVVNR